MLKNESRRHPSLTQRGAEPFIDRIKTVVFDQLTKSEEVNHVAELLNTIEDEAVRNYLTAHIQKECAERPKVVLAVLQQQTSLFELTMRKAYTLRQKVAKAVWGMDDMWKCIEREQKYDSEEWPTYSSPESSSSDLE